MTRAIRLALFLFSLVISGCTGTKDQEPTFTMTQIEGLGVVESVDKIALTDPKYEDYRGQEISIVLSKVNDPKLLFDYFEEFDKKYRTVSK